MSDFNFLQIYGVTLVVEILRVKVFNPYKIFDHVKKEIMSGGQQQGQNPMDLLK